MLPIILSAGLSMYLSVFRVGSIHPAIGLGGAHRLRLVSHQKTIDASRKIVVEGNQGERNAVFNGYVDLLHIWDWAGFTKPLS